MHLYEHIEKQCQVKNPYTIRPFLLRSHEAKLSNALVVQTYSVRLKRKDGQDSPKCRTVVPSGRLQDAIGKGGSGSQFPWKPSTSQALHHASLFYYYASQFSHLLFRIFIQIKYCIVKRRDLMKWYMKSSWQRAQLIQIMPARIAHDFSGVRHGTKKSTCTVSFSIHGSPRYPGRVSDLPRVTQLRSVTPDQSLLVTGSPPLTQQVLNKW